jgi:hypothetical protein
LAGKSIDFNQKRAKKESSWFERTKMQARVQHKDSIWFKWVQIWTPSKVGLSIEVETPLHSSSHNLHQCILPCHAEHSTNLQHIKTIYMANTHNCHHQTWLITAIAHLQEEDNLLLSPFLFLFLGKNIKLYNKGSPSVFKPWLLKQREKEGNFLFFLFFLGEGGWVSPHLCLLQLHHKIESKNCQCWFFEKIQSQRILSFGCFRNLKELDGFHKITHKKPPIPTLVLDWTLRPPLARKIQPIPSFLPLFQLLAFLQLALTK